MDHKTEPKPENDAFQQTASGMFRNSQRHTARYWLLFSVLMFSSIAWAAEVLVCFKEGLEKL
jgi:hypothetical protein